MSSVALPHRWNNSRCGVDRSEIVDLHFRFELIVGKIPESARQGVPGVRDEHVTRAEVLYKLTNCVSDRMPIAHIGAGPLGIRAEFFRSGFKWSGAAGEERHS